MMANLFEIQTYHTATGHEVFADWLHRLRDTRAKVAIIRRVNRMEHGNFGDHKPCRKGVWELRIDVGSGYRVYYARSGKAVILLLCGGDKRTQQSDITRAGKYWLDWQQRSNREDKQ